MEAAEQLPAPTALPPLTKVPIAQLSPALEELQEKCIHANVTLVWPYSSSTKSLSLLLSEPDFRLRRLNGQVKAIFHGRVAEKVAKSQVGIGDMVRLALKGADFAANDATTQTPGRCVAWDLHFASGVSVEIIRSSQDLPTVIIEQHVHAPHDTELPPPSTPRVIEIDPDSDAASGPGSWGSPAFLKSARSSYGGTLDTAYDPFTEDDGTVPGKGRKKPRYSLRREEWRILDEPDSPREREGTVDWDQAIEEELNTERTAEAARDAQAETETQPSEAVPMDTQDDIAVPVEEQRSLFVKPLLEQASSVSGREAQRIDTAHLSTGAGSHFIFGAASHLPTDTPQLRPIPSPGLPIPSPIITNPNNAQEYFSGFHTVPRTQTTQTIATEASTATNFAQDSPGPTSLATQHAIPLAAEESVFFQSQEEVHRTEGPSALTGNTVPVDRMELFTTPAFNGQPEFNETDIEMEAEDRALEMVEVENIAHYRPERNGLNQDVEEGHHEELEQEELEREELEQEHLEQEDEEEGSQFTPELPHEEPRLSPESTKSLGTDYPPGHPSIGTPDEQTPEDEPEAYDYHDANRVEVTDMPQSAGSGTSLSPDYSEDGSHAAEYEVLSDEEDAAESTSQDDEALYEEGEDEGDLDDDNVGLPQQPRPPNAQPEVIVLDSDSEDELASDQPAATPSQPVRHERSYEESLDQSAASASDDEERDWSSVDEEPDYDEMDGERVHESDLEDESSVDVLARDGDGAEDTMPGSSMEHENEGASAGEEAEGPSSEGGMPDGGKTGWAPENAIDLSSDVEEPQEAEMNASYDENERLRLAASASKGLNGLDERDWAQPHILPKEYQPENSGGELFGIQEPEVPSWEGLPLVQTKIGSPPPDYTSVSIEPGHEQQLPTPDPTQETVSRRQASLIEDEPARPSGLVAQGPSVSFDLPSRTLTDGAVESGALASELDDMLSAPPAPEAPPDDLPTSQQPQESTEADVVIPTTESVPVHEQEEDDHFTSPQASTVRKLSVPDRHAHGLRSKLSYFAPLATLVDHYNALVDTISVVYEKTSIAKAISASKDYYVTIQLTDPSMAGTTLQAQIFRRYKSALPTLAEGNVILLRNFKVRSYDHAIMLVSVESSSWAVFDESSPEAQMNGPPVEYGSEERAYTSGLRRWYQEVGAAMVADNKLQAAVERDSMERESTPSDVASSESGSMVSVPRGDSIQSARSSRRSRKSHRRVTIHELRDGTRYTEVGSPNSRESIHELRDGTVYANL